MASESKTADKLEKFDWDSETPEKVNNEFFGNETTTKSENDDEEEIAVETILNEEDEVETEGDEDDKTDDEEVDELSEEQIEALDDEEKEAYEARVAKKEEKEKKLAKEAREKEKLDKDKKPTTTTKKSSKEIVPGQEEDLDTTPKELYAALADELKENGNLEFVDIPKKKALSRKEFFELQAKNDEARLDNNLKEMFEGLDETGVTYLKFIKNGGRTEDFVNTFVNEVIPDLNIDDPKVHDEFLEYYYTQIDGQTPEEAKESIELLDESADKTKKARTVKRLYSKVKEAEAIRKQELLETTDKKEKKAIKEAQEFATKLKEITSANEVMGVPLNGDDKKTLGDYITKPTKTLNGRKVPQWQYDLNEALKDEKKLVVLAKLLKSKFDLGFIKIKANTTVANNTRRSLENLRAGGKDTKSSGSISAKKSLADYFPG